MKIQKPATPSGLNFSELNGSLLLIWVHNVEKDVSTSYGPKDALNSDVHVLDGQAAGQVYRNTLIFPGLLVGQLKGSAGSGDPTLGRLGQGLAKKNQSAPWLLDDPTEGDEEIAAKYVERLPIGVGALGGDGEPPF